MKYTITYKINGDLVNTLYNSKMKQFTYRFSRQVGINDRLFEIVVVKNLNEMLKHIVKLEKKKMAWAILTIYLRYNGKVKTRVYELENKDYPKYFGPCYS